MKRYFVYLMMALVAFVFNACGDDDPEMEEPGTEQPGTPNDPTDNPDDPDDPDDPDTPTENSKILVAYFSWGGTTQRMAQQIETLTGADLFRIEPVTPYPEDYTECTEVALEERDTDARLDIKDDVESWEQYDTIFIGCPVWWHTAPMIICTFAESYDFSGKTVIPFCTYASTYRDETLARIVELTSGAETHLEGLGLTSGRLNDESNVEGWLREIGIIE